MKKGSIYLILDQVQWEFDIDIEYSVSKSGIGAYEYNGVKGFDEGQAFVEEVYPIKLYRHDTDDEVLWSDSPQMLKDAINKRIMEMLESGEIDNQLLSGDE